MRPIMLFLAAAGSALAFPADAGNFDLSPRHAIASREGDGLVRNHFTWKAPSKNDLRSPCPFMNTLANHGFVAHDGRNITLEPFIKGVTEGLGLSRERAQHIFETGLQVNPTPNATFFDLDMLHRSHGLIEHDGSLSRKDIFFDPSNKFDDRTFNNFVSYFGKSWTIDTKSLSNARARHALDMSRFNPEFGIKQKEVPVILGENAMLLVIFGYPDFVANRAFVEYFFRKERLPVVLGWKPSTVPLGDDGSLGQIVNDLINLTPSDVPLTFSPKPTPS